VARNRKRIPTLTPRARRTRYAVRKALWAGLICAVLGALVLADRLGVFGRAPLGDLAKYDGKTFRVVRVVDGDTLDVDCPDGKYPETRVRLWGVDTPETVKQDTPVQYFGPQASKFTKDFALGKRVRLQLEPQQTRDRYGRLLAYVIGPDGTMFNRRLVAEGYAYADPRYPHRRKDEFRRLQRSAMRARRGLWAHVRREDLPYYYRNSLKLPTASQ